MTFSASRTTLWLLSFMLGVGGEWLDVLDFGPNPTNLSFALYVPETLQAKPPVLLTLHGCGGDGPSYASYLGYTALADDRGFIVVAPSTVRDHHVGVFPPIHTKKKKRDSRRPREPLIC